MTGFTKAQNATSRTRILNSVLQTCSWVDPGCYRDCHRRQFSIETFTCEIEAWKSIKRLLFLILSLNSTNTYVYNYLSPPSTLETSFPFLATGLSLSVSVLFSPATGFSASFFSVHYYYYSLQHFLRIYMYIVFMI